MTEFLQILECSKALLPVFDRRDIKLLPSSECFHRFLTAAWVPYLSAMTAEMNADAKLACTIFFPVDHISVCTEEETGPEHFAEGLVMETLGMKLSLPHFC